jgi:hypothetical protein
MLDGTELNYFMHQCTKHILGNDVQYVGFPVTDFMQIIKQSELDPQTQEAFSDKILRANEMQKSAILKVLFSNYVDEKNDEHFRKNCLSIVQDTWNEYNDEAIAEISGLYSSYIMKNASKKNATILDIGFSIASTNPSIPKSNSLIVGWEPHPKLRAK